MVKFRGKTRAFLRQQQESNISPCKSATSSPISQLKIPLSLWISSLPWETRQGLGNHNERSLAYNYPSSLQAHRTQAGAQFIIPGMLFHHSELNLKLHGQSCNEILYHVGKAQFDIDIYFFKENFHICGSGHLRHKYPREVVRCPADAMFALEVKSGALFNHVFNALEIPHNSLIDGKFNFIDGWGTFSHKDCACTSLSLASRKLFNQKIIAPFAEFLSSPSTHTIPHYRSNGLHHIEILEDPCMRLKKSSNFTMQIKTLEAIGLTHIFEHLQKHQKVLH